MVAGESPHKPSRLALHGELDGLPQAFVLTVGTNTIGTHPDNTVVLNVRGVSRHHAAITCEDGAIRLRDLGSKNGTYVNGARVTDATLRPGDVVCFGPARLELIWLEASDAEVVRVFQRQGVRAPEQTTMGGTTSGQAELPVSWLTALEPLVAVEAFSQPAVAQLALQSLVKALQASGAVLVEWSTRSPLTVLHSQGAVPHEALGKFQKEVSSRAREGRWSAPFNTLLLEETTPPLVAAWRSVGEWTRALLVAGDFPARRASLPLLAVVGRALTGGSAEPLPPEEPKSLPVGERRLVFPPGYVPGSSSAMKSVYHQLGALVAGDLPVLILGETGVGKEPIARILHLSSRRAKGPFVAVNCAAIPTELLEVELFGIEAGVATGVTKRDGKFKLAEGGVIFLDEISDMSPALQAKLLRVLQEREINPVGARRPIPVDVRVLSATNADLRELVAQGRFRHDLYFRVAGYTLRVPPLRERREDIPELVTYFLEKFALEVGKTVAGISVRALDILTAAPWPGNVRELENEVRRLVYLCSPKQPVIAEMLSPSLLSSSQALTAGDTGSHDLNLQRQTEELERRLILAAFERSGGKVCKAAQLLGLSRQGLRLKMHKLGLALPDGVQREGERRA
ncbi:MAG: sigma 54-interacting transcriptional regulator [Thermoanaerobaculum sp.]